jgi:hypothetical protein
MADDGPRHLVSYFGNRYLDHLERDLAEIRDHGFDGVVHCITEADHEWGMRRVGEMFAMTREAGLSCWADPWGVAGVFGGEAHSGYLARGGTVGAEDRGLLALLHNWTDEVAAAGAEWMFWDEPDLGLGHGSDALVPFLEEVTSYARDRGLRNSVCLTSTVPNLPAFPRLAALDSVDDIGTDPYYKLELDERDPDPDDYVGVWAQRVREIADDHGKTSHIWVQAFHIGEGHEHRIGRCLDVARGRGVTRLGVWGFRACEALEIRPARPDVAWEVVREAIAGAPGRDAAAT